ncbi:MAG: transposase [candidate division NC10 bacterium]|nr:transposase [candidate division NC10 bacterium]
MARRPRIHVPGGLYHVIARGNRRQAIFRSPQDYGGYLRRLEEGLRRTGTRCFAFVLMPNHVHLLLEAGQAPLARLMQGLQQGYTQEFNRRHGLIGHVFQGRYKAILCDRDAYLLELVRYLHLNPIRTKLAQDPADYHWSSHRAYLGRERIPWLSAEPVLGMFHSERRVASRAYTRFLAEGLPQGHRDDLYEVWEQRYLGDERFVERLERQVRETLPKVRAVTITDILRIVAEEFGCSVKEIISSGQHRVAAQARHWIALLASEVAGERISAAASVLRRSPGSLSVGITRLRRSLLENPAEGKRLQRLCGILRQRSHPKYKKGKS